MPPALPDTVLMTADTVGGVWTYALELTRSLQQCGIQVYLATMGEKPDPGQRRAAERVSNLVLEESSFSLEWMDDPWEDVEAAGQWLLELEQEVQPDLVHLNSYVYGSLPWQSPVLVTGHSCVLSWWRSVKGEEAPPSWQTYFEKVKEGLQSADYVIGVTGYMLECLNRHYGPFTSSGVIYNTRGVNRFSPAQKENFIFSMGRLWDEAKNIGALEDISGQLDWPVFLAGENRGKRTFNGSNVKTLGKLDESQIAEWLGRAGIYVMPARYEPFGLSVLEAALSGCALVLGDIPSLREVWGDAALFADPEDHEALSAHLQQLINNPTKREEMAGKALERAKRYSPERFTNNYAEVYQQLVQTKISGHLV